MSAPAQPQKLFSIIVPTCNRNEILVNCLNMLAATRQSLNDSFYEVIVTDDGKEQNAQSLILERYSWVKWVQGPKDGPAANRNNGVKYANGNWLVFIDDDCIPDKDWLLAYKQALDQNNNISAFEGAILPDNWDLLDQDMAECPINTNGGCFWSANIAIEKSLFHLIGGFDENYKIAAQEDQDIFIRVKANTEVFFVDKASVKHDVRIVSLKKKIKSLGKSYKNWLYYVRKNQPGSEKKKLLTGCWVYSKLFIIRLSKGKIKGATYNFINIFYSLYLFLLYSFKSK